MPARIYCKTPAGEEALPGSRNYFIGNDPKGWLTDVPAFARIRYANLYPGVDWVFYTADGRLKSDFVVAPGSAPEAVRLVIEGGGRLATDRAGNLLVDTAAGR